MSMPKQAHGGQRIPHEVVPKLVALRAQGMSCAAIARAMGVGYATAHRAINGAGAYAAKA